MDSVQLRSSRIIVDNTPRDWPSISITNCNALSANARDDAFRTKRLFFIHFIKCSRKRSN